MRRAGRSQESDHGVYPTVGGGATRVGETRTFLTFESSLRELRAWLVGEQVTHVAMEATGVYWKPISGVAVGAQGAARGVAAASTRSACESSSQCSVDAGLDAMPLS